jgi:hypothetical protein
MLVDRAFASFFVYENIWIIEKANLHYIFRSKLMSKVKAKNIIIFSFICAVTAAYLCTVSMSGEPSPTENCKKQCARDNRNGKLVESSYFAQDPSARREKRLSHCSCF